MRLNAFPTGLLSLVGSQSFGTAPKDLAETIVPTVELREMFLLSAQTVVTGVSNPLVNGLNMPITVPVGEVWRVHAFSSSIVTAVGESGRFTLGLVSDNARVAISDTIDAVASQERYLSLKAQPFWLDAGGTLGVIANGVAGVPIGGMTALVSRLRA